ncbi:Calcium and integrin-binding protein 1 [Armadillidium nasatum]|uniref:Calcium and integrin-binding protein 1 n=1 Tax=Armadillidium nasatum TaxID=96803 RepID=A0A5N5SP43_9CRUS|nr:Calcium and integrin-binding protein 1 [Armadillidium nasatum]
MGQGNSQFTEAELEDYQHLTYFTKKEILYAHKRFKELAPERVSHNRNAKLPMSKLLTMPELRANPFGDRDFLDMMSAFSDAAPKSVKAEYAFRIFDFDGDDYLGREDLVKTIERLIHPQRFKEDDLNVLINRIYEEADLDDDGMLAFAEFEHVISKSPDFSK